MAYKKVSGNADEFWKPEKKGDVLEGVLDSSYTGQFGKTFLVATKNGKKIGTPSHAVLQNVLERVLPGDRVRITYLGEVAAKKPGQSATKTYEVEVDDGRN